MMVIYDINALKTGFSSMVASMINPAKKPGRRCLMKGLKISLLIAAQFFIALSLFADIYEWTDANGVKHFTNYAPPDNAKLLMKTEAVPYDEAADIERIETEQQDQLELERQEIAEREAELERKVAEAERRLAALDRQAEKIEREAEDWSDETADDAYIDSSYDSYGSYGYYPGYYTYPRKQRWYYRGHSGGIYYKKPHYKRYHRYHHYKKNNYRHHKNRFFKNNHFPKHHFRSHSKQTHGKHHYRFQGRQHYGQSNFNRGRIGYSRR
jgi:hypothetical protein